MRQNLNTSEGQQQDRQRLAADSRFGASMKTETTVFIVDDEPAIREQLMVTAESAGYVAETFDSAEAFLETFDLARPGCLVLDVRLPGMDGIELQRKLGEMDAVLPIIMISGFGDIPMAVQTVKAGAVDFLEKPFRQQDLLDRIRVAIRRDAEARADRASRADVRKKLAKLTPRETEVLDLIISGQSNRLIASKLAISHKTVESHRTKIMDKVGALGLADLTRMVLMARGF